MSWGTELWDQYDKISGHTENRIDFIKRVSSFVEKRIHAEHSYAKDLRKLVKGFVRKEDDDSSYSAIKSFSKMINEVNDLAGQRELISEYLEAEVLVPLKGLARDIANERRKHLATGTDLHRQFKIQMDTLERTKKQYEKAMEEAEAAQHKLEKADNDPNSTKAKIDQLTTILRQKEQIAEDCTNNYILQVDSTNDFRRDHFHQKMPELFSEMQRMNASLINKYKDLVAQFADCHRRVSPVVFTCLDNITEASNSIDAEKDNEQLVVDIKTGFPIPGDVAMEEYMGKQAKKAQKKGPAKVEPKEDCSHLPPEQRRRRLQQKVDSIEALITKARSDRTAMEKMKDIYSQQPSLGDPNAVAKSLEMNSQKIMEYEAELQKFKGYLANAEQAQKELQEAPPPKPNKHQLGAVSAKPTKSSPKPAKKNDKKKDKKKDKAVEENESDEEDETPISDQAMQAVRNSEEWSDGDGGDELNEPARVLYDFTAQNEEELSVTAGDDVLIVEDLGDGWLRVKSKGQEGYVPESYVQRDQ